MTADPYTPDEAELIGCYAGAMEEQAGENYATAKADAERGIAKIKVDARAEGMFRFKGRAVTVDDSGYYYARWGIATPIETLASTRDEANEKSFAMLGDSDRRGFSWRIKWDSIEEEA